MEVVGVFLDVIYLGHCVYVTYTTHGFDTFPYCSTITTVALANISTRSRNCHFSIVLRTYEIQSLRSFEVQNAVLLTKIMIPNMV